MLKYGNKEFRNLEEQVRQNKDDIARHYAQDRVLADFGIKIVGQVDTPAELPDPATYEGNYGDAYAVGPAAPYTYYIWTRANNVSPIDYWFDFGEISIVGPQGPKGDTIIGPKGNPGNRWFVGSNPPTGGGYNIGDMYLNPTTGEVRRYQQLSVGNYGWATVGNIKGATGAPGPRGENAGTIQIAAVKGKVPSLEVLSTIDPETVPAGTAYFVGEDLPYEVYMPINGMWDWVGTFSAGTIAVEDNVPVSVINMNNYINVEGSNLGEWQDDYETLYGDYGVIPVLRGDNYVYDFVTITTGQGEDSEGMPPDCIPKTDADGLIRGASWDAQNYAVDDNGYTQFLPSFNFLLEKFSAMSVPVQIDIEADLGQEGTLKLFLNRVATTRAIDAVFTDGMGQYQFETFKELAHYLYAVDNGAEWKKDLAITGTYCEQGRGEVLPFTIRFEPNPRYTDAYQIRLYGLHLGGQTTEIVITDQGLEWGNISIRETSSLFIDY